MNGVAHRIGFVSLGLALAIGGLAAAQEPEPEATPPPPPTGAAAPEAEPAVAPTAPAPAPTPSPAVAAATAPSFHQGRLNDANIDRAWLTPTAMTQPARSISVNDYEVFLIGATYGVSDRFQLSAATWALIVQDMPFTGMLSGKFRFLDTGRLHVAATGTFSFMIDRDNDLSNDTIWGATLGGVLSYCLDEACDSMVSGNLFTGFSEESSSRLIPLVFGGSFMYRLTRRMKLVLEADSAAVTGDETEFAKGALFSYGLRFHSGELAGDIGFLRFIDPNNDWDDTIPIGIPWVTFTYRAL